MIIDQMNRIYGFGNALIDVEIQIEDDELESINIKKVIFSLTSLGKYAPAESIKTRPLAPYSLIFFAWLNKTSLLAM